MRRILAIILALAVLMSLAACTPATGDPAGTEKPNSSSGANTPDGSAAATEPTESPEPPRDPSDGLNIAAGSDSCILIGIGTCTDTDIVIPATYEGLPVTEIGDFAFAANAELTSITIPEGITKIGQSAFAQCTKLARVTIPSTVTRIGYSAFQDCTGLSSISLPESLQYLAGNAFENCSQLMDVENGISYISSWAVAADSNLTTASIRSDTVGIAIGTFKNQENLAELTIPNSVVSICQDAFRGCSNLRSVTIGSAVTSIGKSAFDECTALEAVHITDLTAWCKIRFASVDATPLYYAKQLYINGTQATDIIIPDGVTEIKYCAFYYCEGLTSVTIPDSVTVIGSNAFGHCGLTDIHFKGTTAQWNAIDKQDYWDRDIANYTVHCTDS